MASIEYAVGHLGAKLIVVLGHERCGAVSAGSPNLDALVAAIQGRLKRANLPDAALKDDRLRNAVEANFNGVAEDLLQKSALLKKKIESGEVAVVRAVYVLESGEAQFWATAGGRSTVTAHSSPK